MSTQTQAGAGNESFRYLVVAALVIGAFFGAYGFAVATNAPDASSAVASAPSPGSQSGFIGGPGSDAAGGGGCASCATCSSQPTEDGITGERVEADAVVDGDVQRIEIDQSAGYYQPNVIRLKAGMPAQLTFGPGAGCTAQVMSKELGFYVEVTGGTETVELPALEPGEYPFYCGMQMLFGKVIVE